MRGDNIGEVLAEYVRAGVVESQHLGHLIALASDGSVARSFGNPDLKIFPRSAIKTIQAAAMVRHCLQLDPRLLALVCASHSGAQIHQDGALEILRGAGLTESDLRNVEDRPLGDAERRAWGEKAPTRLAMNCSGKHAGMLATCVANGWDRESYLDPAHPLQVAIKKEFEDLAGEKIELTTADGCGAPLFLLSLAGVARAIRGLTISTDPVHQEVITACRSNPVMMSGEGRLVARLMVEVDGFFMKEGAEGVNVASMPDGRTIAFKVMDGSTRAHEPITRAAMRALGIDVAMVEPPVLGGGQVIGAIRATF